MHRQILSNSRHFYLLENSFFDCESKIIFQEFPLIDTSLALEYKLKSTSPLLHLRAFWTLKICTSSFHASQMALKSYSTEPSITWSMIWLSDHFHHSVLRDKILLIKFVVAVVESFSHVRLCDPMDCSAPGFPILNNLPEFAQIHIHWIGDPIQSSHPLSSSSALALNLSQHQDLLQ